MNETKKRKKSQKTEGVIQCTKRTDISISGELDFMIKFKVFARGEPAGSARGNRMRRIPRCSFPCYEEV
jgi:hypothetical protein